MENAKHIFFSVLFALFALAFIFLGISGSATKHYDWWWICGFVALIYIICFIFEIGKINSLKRIMKQLNTKKKEQNVIVKILHQKEKELEKTVEEINEDKKIIEQLKHEIKELSEEVDIVALEKKNSKEAEAENSEEPK